MKKLILLSAAGLLGFGADAQQANQSVVKTGGDVNAKISAAPIGAGSQITQTRYRNNAKTTATPFYTETFGTGTRTSLPTGWTAPQIGGHAATWKWTNARSMGGSGGNYSIPAIASTSASDGWMIYDSDSIGDLNPSLIPIIGGLVSPVINCSSHSSVLVSFQNYFRKFRDSTYVDVSINGGTSWTTFPVLVNNTMGNNTTNANNPEIVRINISSVAANQSSVQLRFRYVLNFNTAPAYGALNWLIDDVTLSEIDPVELSINNSGMFQYMGGNNELTNYSLFSNYPKTLIDSVLPITYIDNNGLNSITNAPLSNTVFLGATQVHNSTTTFPLLPANAIDSIMDWQGFKPTQTGAYTATFRVSAPGDGFAGNDVDTQRFAITDTVLTTYGATLAGGYYLHRPAASGELSYQQGVRFDIPAGKSDTLTSVSVSFDNDTQPGVNTVVQLYRITGTSPSLNWSPVATMQQKQLTAADISPATGAATFTTYVINTQASGGIAPFILTGGSYAAIVKTINAPASSSVVINAAVPIIDRYNISGYYGQADTSDNVTGYSFSPVGIATGTAGTVPYMRVNFGTIPKPGSVATINGVTIGNAFPNPANSTLNVPVTVATGASINVSISNMVGQVLQAQSLGNIAGGQTKTAVFNTSSLAPGVYLYTVESNGERVTNRVVVAH